MKHERMRIEPYEGLGGWLERVEHIGEIRRIKAEVDPYLEMATIASLASREVGGPALLFENIKGHPGQRALFNPFGTSVKRLALAHARGSRQVGDWIWSRSSRRNRRTGFRRKSSPPQRPR